jgi:hypothetical protein
MVRLQRLLKFFTTSILLVTLWHSATAMVPPEGLEQQQRVPRVPLTRIPRPAPNPPAPVPPPAAMKVVPPPAAAPAAPSVAQPTDCAQMLLKGQPVDLSICSNPRQVTGSFVSTLVRGGYKDAAAMGPDGLMISNGSIEGDLDLSSSQVSYRLTFENVQFRGTVECRECELGGHVNLRKSMFCSTVDFGSAQVHRTMELENADFCDTASFAGMTVDGMVYLDNSVFVTGADFTDVNVTGTVQAYGASFVDDPARPHPNRSACPERSLPTVAKTVQLAKEEHAELDRCGRPLEQKPAEKKNATAETKFQQANIEGSLILFNNHSGALNARQLRAGHDLQLVWVHFDGPVNFSGSSVGKDLRLVTPVFGNPAIGFDGVSYGAITTDDKGTVNPDQTWAAMRPILAGIDFNRDVYKRLEEYFATRGEARLADDVFIAMKKRERAMLPWFQKVGNVVQWVVLRYGRTPELAFLWGGLAVLVGIFVFQEKRMVPRDDTPPTRYSAFWYSLDAFLPLTHLDAVDEWAPHPNQRATWFYFRCHQLLGWILIPLGLASITGVIK